LRVQAPNLNYVKKETAKHHYRKLKGLRPLRLYVVRQMSQVGKPAHDTGSSVT